jgi:hypothetical protein
MLQLSDNVLGTSTNKIFLHNWVLFSLNFKDELYAWCGIVIVLLVVKIFYTQYQTNTNILHAKLQSETKKAHKICI